MHHTAARREAPSQKASTADGENHPYVKSCAIYTRKSSDEGLMCLNSADEKPLKIERLL
jgi:hypothetical protein